MYDTQVTVQGWVGGPVTFHEFDGDARLAKFRLGSTPRLRKDGDWVDGETAWYSVRCWGALGRHVADSVQRGEPVLVAGRLRRSSWTSEDGVEHADWEVEASGVGHDLSRGTSRYVKPPSRAARPASPEGAGADAEDTDDGARVSDDGGEPVDSAADGGWRVPAPG